MTSALQRPPAVRMLLAAAILLCQTQSSFAGGVPKVSGERPVNRVVDVALDAEGVLRGQLIDTQARRMPHADVVVAQGTQVVAETQTDLQGRFQLSGLRGGTYLVWTDGAGQVCRVWAPRTAPPAAVDQVLLVQSGEVARGQSFRAGSLYEWIEQHPVVSYTAITAAIALPIILLNQDDDDEPAS